MGRTSKKANVELTFDEQLVLFKFFLDQLGIAGIKSLAHLNSKEYEGVSDNDHTKFLQDILNRSGLKISKDKLNLYDENIRRHTKHIGEKRGGITWKYFQYISLLFTEMYLDAYFSDKESLCSELNKFLAEQKADRMLECKDLDFSDFSAEKLNKLAFMCATGSGKTLLMHVHILQFMDYFKKAKRSNSKLSLNKIIVLTPNEGLSRQHLDELKQSSISAAIFQKDGGTAPQREDVLIIDINKLEEEGKVKTVSVGSFESNNLVLVDEGHRGLAGDIWYDFRTRLSAEGFSFEYSATFKQALKASSKKKEDRLLMEEYGKSIIMDYSYKYFYNDGYGKDYRIFNLKTDEQGKILNPEQENLYLTGCLLSFYQQLKVYDLNRNDLKKYFIEKPLLVFVGNRVVSANSKEDLTDIQKVLEFIDSFVRNPARSAGWIHSILNSSTGLMDKYGNELFAQTFNNLKDIWEPSIDVNRIEQELFRDILKLMFNADSVSDEPRLHLENLKQNLGEVGLKIGQSDKFFGVINVGDAAGLCKVCEEKGMVVDANEMTIDSLFTAIKEKNSPVNVLIGSRKFTEGWNSWRVSTMGLINFAKSEGSQAIQLFGRGVRLKGLEGCLKRSSMVEKADPPRYIGCLETLTIFGVKANYMDDFRKYLEQEGVQPNDMILEFHMPVLNRYKKAQTKKLRTIRLQKDKNFKKQAKRLILDVPSDDFKRYLLKNKIVLDCRSKIESVDSFGSLGNVNAMGSEQVLPAAVLDLLDYGRMFEELEMFKNEKNYFNICLIESKLKDILAVPDWYGLLIPKQQLELDSFRKLETMTDFAVMVLKSYIDKFFKFERERWESQYLEYGELEIDDNNFVSDYSITYTVENPQNQGFKELEALIDDLKKNLDKFDGMDVRQKSLYGDKMVFFDFKNHLYAPLIYLKSSNLGIKVSPVCLNDGEKDFVNMLIDYAETKKDKFDDKSLFLLRNKSKVGMGFFEAGNFYPDFILWIDAPKSQYVTFIDPKGLLNIPKEDPKVEFHKTIKDLEKRLTSSAGDKPVVLNSFIMSSTKAADLKERWAVSQAEYEAKNVYTLDNIQSVEKMIDKILEE